MTVRSEQKESNRTRVVTLHQPFASLVALGVKTLETRSWPAPEAAIGQRLLIHAAARPIRIGRDPHWYGDWHVAQGGTWMHGPDRTDKSHRLPLGAIVASCTLAACVPMVGTGEAKIPQHHLHVADHDRTLWLNDADAPSVFNVTDQRPYGDFAPGRWAWLLEDVKPTTERCPACWGTGEDGLGEVIDGEVWGWGCDTCGGTGSCDPIPAKGFQRIWWWKP